MTVPSGGSVDELRAALADAERRLRETQALTHTGSWELDLTTNHLWWSDETFRIFELDQHTFGASFEAFLAAVHPEDRSRLQRVYAESVASRAPYAFSHRIVLAGGRVKHVFESGYTVYADDGRPLRSIGVVQDVTETVETAERAARAHQVVQESEERLRQAIRVAEVGIFEHDHQRNLFYWSPRHYEIFGLAPDAPVSLDRFMALVHPDDRERVHSTIALAHDPSGDGLWDAEYRVVRADGETRALIARSQTFFTGGTDHRAPARTVGAVIDVTDLRLADEAMRVKDRAMASSLNALAIGDATGLLTYVNPAFVRLWGYESEREIVGRAPTLFASPEHVAAMLDALQTRGHFHGEILARRRDGTTFDALASATAVYDTRGRLTHLMSSFLDVSHAKFLQAQLLQAQKMESVGRLAGGVAHDFNNLLTVIKGQLEFALDDAAGDDRLTASLLEIRSAADSAVRLTQQLLAFSRKQVIAPEVLDLNEVISDVERLLGRLLGEHIQLRTVCTEPLGRVRFDRSQCQQILVNLAVNARDAMPDGGLLTIETADVHIDETYVERHPDIVPGEYVMLAVSDNGTGMDAEVRSHLFEPFFTTKGPGRGTGLGLSMVFGAVAQNGGRLEVYSEPGHGATFKIYLPRVDGDAAAHAQAPGAGVEEGGTETVVLVEDDASVRQFATLVLARRGYRVLGFRDGDAALDALDAELGPMHLLVTDVIMPGMNGRVLAERMTERLPALRVLFTSGYTENVIVHHGVLNAGLDFLPKPYSGAALLRKVREILDRT